MALNSVSLLGSKPTPSGLSADSSGSISIASTVNSSSTSTGALVIGSGTNGGLGVAGSVFVGNDVDTGRYMYVGTRTASSGAGGNFRVRDDTGTQRWLVGILGSAAATSFSVYDIVAASERFRVDPSSGLAILNSVKSQSAWSSTGALFNSTGTTITDSSTAASGTAAAAVFHSFQTPALAATNSSVTTTNVANVYINGDPTAGSNQTITNSYGLWNAGKTRLDGVATMCAATATPAGGSTSARLLFGTTSGFGIYYGSGVPTVSAAQGSIYLRSDGSSTSTRLYVNTNGSTTWTNVTTAA